MKTKGQPRVYSYARFSSPEQAKGDSERRQWDLAKEFAKSQRMPLDDSLRMVDRGLSGFHGSHRERGVFGIFLDKVKNGEVPTGSILLVENIDRLGREPVLTAMETIGALLRQGIIIQTLSPPDTFKTQTVNDGGHWRLFAHIERAHAESKRKSDLAQANWKQKRAIASKDQILTAKTPAWLKVKFHTENNRVVRREVTVNPKAAETIRLMFKLKLAGFGKGAIERRLNKEASWTPPKNKKRKTEGWRASYIEKILRSRAVIGEYQPHKLDENGKRKPEGEPILKYFPEIVPPATFHAVQARMAGNRSIKGRGGGGRTGKATNVFQNLVRCGYCGGPMVFVDKGKPPKGGQYLVCDNGRRGVELVKQSEGGKKTKFKCHAHCVSYPEFESTLLSNLSKLRPETVLPKQDEQAKQAKQLRDRITGLEGELGDIERQIENFFDQIGRTSSQSNRDSFEARIEKLKIGRDEVKIRKAQSETALEQLERGRESFTKWQADLAELKKAIAKDKDTRIRLKTHLKELIEKIEIFPKGDESNVEHCEALIEEYVPELERAKETYLEFRHYLRKRLLSRDGRFYKLHPRTYRPESECSSALRRARATGVPIAPESSLAFRLESREKAWKARNPKLDILFKEFFDGRRQGFAPKASRL